MLKSTSGWESNGNGEDAFGFSALPADYYSNGYFHCVGFCAYFWSSTEYESNSAHYLKLNYNSDYAYLYYNSKYRGYSVRCVKD